MDTNSSLFFSSNQFHPLYIQQSSLFNNYLKLQRRVSTQIQQGQAINTKNQFQLQQISTEHPKYLNNRNLAVQNIKIPQSSFTSTQGMPSLFILPYEDSKWFQPIASQNSYTQLSIFNKQEEIILLYDQKRQALHQIAIECKNFVLNKKQQNQEASIIKNAVNASKLVYDQIRTFQTQKNVSESFINQIMQEKGALGNQGNISHLIYKKSSIQSILDVIPLNLQAEKLREIYPGDSHLQRFTTLYLLKAFEIGQKYAVASLPDGNQKVLLRYLSSFYKINKPNQVQHINRSLIIFTQNALQFIQNEDFRSFYNSVTVKIVLIDQDCRIQRNPGRERSRKHEMFNFGVEKMEFFKRQEKSLQTDVFIFDSNCTVNIVLIEMAALEKEDEIQKAIKQVQEATKIYEYDTQLVYHLDSYMRKRGPRKLPKVHSKLKIVILSEMKPRSWVDIVQILLCDEVREADVKHTLQEKCQNYLKNIYYKPTQDIIEKSVCSIEYQEKKVILSGNALIVAEQYLQVQKLSQVISVLQNEIITPNISLLQDSSLVEEDLQKQINDEIKKIKFQNSSQNDKVASCLQEDLSLLCAKTISRFVQPKIVQQYHQYHVQPEQTINQALKQLEKVQVLLNSPKDIFQLNLGLPVKLQFNSYLPQSQQLQYILDTKTAFKKQLKIVSKEVIRRLPVQLQLRFSQAVIQDKVGRNEWKKRAIKFAQLRTFQENCSSILFPSMQTLKIFQSICFTSSENITQEVIKNFEFLNYLPSRQFELSIPQDILLIEAAQNQQFEFCQKSDIQHTFNFQTLENFNNIDNDFLILGQEDIPKSFPQSLPQQQKHPLFSTLDNVLQIQVQKYFETENIINKANKLKINISQLRIVTKVIILCDQNDINNYQAYIRQNYSFIHKQSKFLITSDLLEIIAFCPQILIIMPGINQKRFEQSVKEIVFKNNVQVFSLQLSQFSFNFNVKKSTLDKVITACNLIPTSNYIHNRITAYLKGSSTFESFVQSQLGSIQNQLKYNCGIYNLVKAGKFAPKIVEYKSINIKNIFYQIYQNTIKRHLQMGNGAYLCISDRDLNDQKSFVKLFVKHSIKQDRLVSYNNAIKSKKMLTIPIQEQQKSIKNNQFKITPYYKFICELNTFINYKGVVNQIDGIDILQRTSILINKQPLQRCYLPRCCMMLDISQYLFQIIQIIQKHSTPVSQVKLFTQKDSFYDQMLHYMDSLHLYAFQNQCQPHVDLKSVSLSIQYQRIQYSQSQVQIPQQQIIYLNKVFQHIHQQFVEQTKYYSLQSQLNVFSTLSKRIHSTYGQIFVQQQEYYSLQQMDSQNNFMLQPATYQQIETKLKQDLSYSSLSQISHTLVQDYDKTLVDLLKLFSLSGFNLFIHQQLFATENPGKLRARYDNEIISQKHEFNKKNKLIIWQQEDIGSLDIDIIVCQEGINQYLDLI